MRTTQGARQVQISLRVTPTLKRWRVARAREDRRSLSAAVRAILERAARPPS